MKKNKDLEEWKAKVRAHHKAKKPAIRKPRDLSFGKDYIASVCESCPFDGREIEEGIDLLNRDISTKEARKIAKFLLKAADYINAKK